MAPLRSIRSVSKVVAHTYVQLQKAKKVDSDLGNIKRDWAKSLVKNFQIQTTVTGDISLAPSTLFVGNHLSYVDIPLLMSEVHDLTFVAKAEIKGWPIIGQAADVAGTVFVKRESGKSRLGARDSIKDALINGKRIAVFPSGTTSLDENLDWKIGAFKIAKEAGALIQAFRISYQPLRPVAYIDDDILPLHLFQLIGRKKVTAQLEFHPPIMVNDPHEDCKRMHVWVKSGISKDSF